MASLTVDVLGHVMSFLEQDDRAACTKVSKKFSEAFKTPRIWTNVHLQKLCPEAKAFVKSCTHLTTLKITAAESKSLDAFLSRVVYPDTIEELTVILFAASSVGSLLLEKLTQAFRCLTSLDVELRGSQDPVVPHQVVMIGPPLTLRSFRFWDDDMTVHLSMHPDFRSDISSIKADSVTGLVGRVDTIWVNSSSLSDTDALPKARELIIELDDEFAIDFLVDAEDLVINTNGYNLFIDATAIRFSQGPLRKMTIEGPEDETSSVTFTPISVEEFFDFFYSPNKQIELKISLQTNLEIWPL